MKLLSFFWHISLKLFQGKDMSIQELMKSVRLEDIEKALRQSYHELKDFQSYERTFNILRTVQPTFDYFDMVIGVKRRKDHVMVTNTHLGSISDLAGRTVDINKDDQLTPTEAAAHIVYQITAHGYDTTRYKDNLDDWDEDMMSSYDEE